MKPCAAKGCDREAVSRGYCMKHYAQVRRTGSPTTKRRMGDFWSKVKKGAPNECWPWQGFTKPSGHGLTSIRGLMMHANRKAWILTHGPIEQGLCVNHRCDNAVCCNPDHMYLGTRSDNAIDQWAQLPPEQRGRGVRLCMLSNEQLAEMWEMRKRGALLRECAEHFGVHIQSICRYIRIVRETRVKELQRVRLSKTKIQNNRKTGT